MKLMVDDLIGKLRKRFDDIADPRNGSNKLYAFANIAMAAFAVFLFNRRLFLNIKELSIGRRTKMRASLYSASATCQLTITFESNWTESIVRMFTLDSTSRLMK